ncbi:MAG TPA: hypothetical protein VNN09_00040 [Candidatus Competibacteraceae bacterium]|nr:hypothetical protein [Candidatus Competibacteraceae bacterium]
MVSEKDSAAYRRILSRYDDDPSRAVIVGNSVCSDVLPMLYAGGWAVHVPYHLTWGHERAEAPMEHPR